MARYRSAFPLAIVSIVFVVGYGLSRGYLRRNLTPHRYFNWRHAPLSLEIPRFQPTSLTTLSSCKYPSRRESRHFNGMRYAEHDDWFTRNVLDISPCSFYIVLS
ncbi:hypothetical protein B0J14DRAFT_604448 [Halenospora varia]|nr:hypothetical protein B0J14DRAFT_604448 [Halenospora varia]